MPRNTFLTWFYKAFMIWLLLTFPDLSIFYPSLPPSLLSYNFNNFPTLGLKPTALQVSEPVNQGFPLPGTRFPYLCWVILQASYYFLPEAICLSPLSQSQT